MLLAMSGDTAFVKTLILKSESKKLLLFSMFRLCDTFQRLIYINDYVLYDGDRAWKCTIQTHLVEELERRRNARECTVHEESGKCYLQVIDQQLELEEVKHETKVEVVNLLLFHLAAQNETFTSGTSCTNAHDNQFLPDVTHTPRKKAKSEALIKVRTGRSLINPVHRKVNTSKGVNFD